MRIAHFFTCDNQAFSYTSHFLLLCIVSFFLNEWVGSDELRSKKCDQQQTNNNITSSLIIRWPSCNTMLQYSRNAINVYMFFIIIAISFYWYGNCFTLHWIRFKNNFRFVTYTNVCDFNVIRLKFFWQDILFINRKGISRNM